MTALIIYLVFSFIVGLVFVTEYTESGLIRKIIIVIFSSISLPIIIGLILADIANNINNNNNITL